MINTIICSADIATLQEVWNSMGCFPVRGMKPFEHSLIDR